MATKDLAHIKLQHDDLVQRMKDQNLRVETYNQQKALESKEKMTRDDSVQKEKIAADIKTKELAIKEQALYL